MIYKIVLTTAFAVTCSVSMSWLFSLFSGSPSWAVAYLMAILCPLMIAPIVSYGLLIQQERLRRLNDELQKAHVIIEEIAKRDGLTGLLNRSSFMADSARALGPSSAFLLIDIDHFKALNDGHGHLAGDAVLVAIGDAIRTVVADVAIAGRVGGEEFAVFLGRTTTKAAASLAEGIRERIAAQSISTKAGACIHVTASIGLGILPNAKCIEDLYGEADNYLYAAKRGGRNRLSGADLDVAA